MVLPKPLKAKRGAQDSLDSLTPLLSQVPFMLLPLLLVMCQFFSHGMSLWVVAVLQALNTCKFNRYMQLQSLKICLNESDVYLSWKAQVDLHL